ncbi:helix-turn-helix domain-containing protein [Lactococcus lactis]|uniref:Helix-turn-helix domain-containing protein n=1 Tax=Lactococcus lactis TaxID=1358 RepID=A0A9X4NJU4_9LACT|nr:helix-turn-helix transcriptional regulator [Lactococcus lactis]MDG4985004.1 helix-turn-helix domain-containing protein [Lactococcus lactis]
MINITIGNQLRKHREARDISLDEAAQLTGVSKPSLSNIERGMTSPSISTLWKISKGLALPISYFFSEKEVVYEIATLENLKEINSGDDLIKTFSAFSWDPSNNFEVLFLELMPGAQRISKAHADRTSEIIIIMEGELKLKIQDNEINLLPKQLLRFNADNDHQYINESKENCKFACIMIYPTK